jgi:hypothetical protein
MASMRRSLWQGAAVRTAVFALLLQAFIASIGCFGERPFPVVASPDSTAAICSAQGLNLLASTDAPHDGPQQPDCLVCLSLACCASAVPAQLTAILTVPLPVEPLFALETWQAPSGAEQFSLRNRGPPSSLQA